MFPICMKMILLRFCYFATLLIYRGLCAPVIQGNGGKVIIVKYYYKTTTTVALIAYSGLVRHGNALDKVQCLCFLISWTTCR